MATEEQVHEPRWQRDLKRFLPLKSQFVLTGAIRDLQVVNVDGALALIPLRMAVEQTLRDGGFEAVVSYDPIQGFKTEAYDPTDREADCRFMEKIKVQTSGGVALAGPELLREALLHFGDEETIRGALIIDLASRLTVRHDALSADEHRLFTLALFLSQRAEPRASSEGRAYFNTIVWIVEKETDLPDWLMIDNPLLRHIPVARPDHLVRRSIAPMLLKSMPGGSSISPEAGKETIDAFVDSTAGMLLHDLMAITELARTEEVSISEIGEAVRRYKVGVTDDPWAKIDREKIRSGEEIIRLRVKGQDHAVIHVLDIVKRAITGVGASRRGGRPRGVIFLAGPTGVGKTELAKTITELLFGDETAYIRFDMSEFSAECLTSAPLGLLR